MKHTVGTGATSRTSDSEERSGVGLGPQLPTRSSFQSGSSAGPERGPKVRRKTGQRDETCREPRSAEQNPGHIWLEAIEKHQQETHTASQGCAPQSLELKRSPLKALLIWK